MTDEPEELEPTDITDEERAYLAALERHVAEGKPLARNRPMSRRAGGQPAVPPGRAGAGGPAAGASDRERIGGRTPIAYRIGAILSLDDGSVGIFKDPAHGKEYQLVYFLEPDGRISPQGVVLEAYKVRELGAVPADFLGDFQRVGRWNRDAVVLHLKNWACVALLPPAAAYEATKAPTVGGISPHGGAPGGTPQSRGEGGSQPAVEGGRASREGGAGSATGTGSGDVLTRGRKFRVKFGANDWDAVYWGKDELGAIVAHCTNKVWNVMHLDLKRFGDQVEYGGRLSDAEVKDIERQLDDLAAAS